MMYWIFSSTTDALLSITTDDLYSFTTIFNDQALEMTVTMFSTSALAIITLVAILIIFFLVWTKVIRRSQSGPEPFTRVTIDHVESQTQPKDLSSIRSLLSFSSKSSSAVEEALPSIQSISSSETSTMEHLVTIWLLRSPKDAKELQKPPKVYFRNQDLPTHSGG